MGCGLVIVAIASGSPMARSRAVVNAIREQARHLHGRRLARGELRQVTSKEQIVHSVQGLIRGARSQ